MSQTENVSFSFYEFNTSSMGSRMTVVNDLIISYIARKKCVDCT